MFSQTPHSMEFYLWTTKWQCRGLGFGALNFHSFVWRIFDILNIILMSSSLLLDGPFSIPTLINHNMFTQWVQDILFQLPFYSYVFIHSWCIHCNLFFVRGRNRVFQLQMRILFPFLLTNNIHRSLLLIKTRSFLLYFT